MKRKSLSITCILIFAVLLTGCVGGTGHLEINRDGSMDLHIEVEKPKALDFWGFEQVENTLKNHLLQSGYELEIREQSTNEQVYYIYKHFDSLKDLGAKQADTMSEDFFSEGFEVQEQDYFFFTAYRVEAVVDMRELLTQFLEEKGLSKVADHMLTDLVLKRILQQIDFEFQLTLPLKSIGDNNAKEVRGSTLLWDISFSEPNSMYLEFTVPNLANILVTISVALLLIGLITFLRKRGVRSKSDQ